MKMFSIIVPIYKIEEYIEECIKSVISQKYDDYELILVDDGSPDNSGNICDKYKEIYSNIRVIHKINGGLSDARNAGLEIANGKYIILLDGDDVLEANCLVNIAEILSDNSQIDLLTCDFSVYGEESIKTDEAIIYKKIEKINDYFNYLDDIPWAAWRNVYVNEKIKSNNLKFVKNLIGAEDCDFFINYFSKSQNIVYTNTKIIGYRNDRTDSITNNIGFNAIKGQLEVFSQCFEKYYLENNCKMYELFARKYLNTISTINNINKKEKLDYIYKNIAKNKSIFKYAKGWKYYFARFLWKIFGYKNGSKILRCIRK